ncbi:GNAT family N-acetyltransferase [Pseudoroseomonas deserti]|uniref:GNAT family N-acetyltransferase n=2 Tax=Teichococcus deserti TaxID=1817963 RepID=A0A1V2GY43_9PROT|nr:GNAT family N-acetyltransferase [Pseudoroseomonas deserti]
MQHDQTIPGMRRATPADAALVRGFTRAAYAKWVEVIGREPRPMTADYDVALREHRIDLVEPDGQLQALIETHAAPDHLLIVNVAVAPEHQGKGLGRALLAHAESLARAAGLAEMRLYTNSRFASNIALYARQGYEQYAEEVLPPLGIVIHMKKTLR